MIVWKFGLLAGYVEADAVSGLDGNVPAVRGLLWEAIGAHGSDPDAVRRILRGVAALLDDGLAKRRDAGFPNEELEAHLRRLASCVAQE